MQPPGSRNWQLISPHLLLHKNFVSATTSTFLELRYVPLRCDKHKQCQLKDGGCGLKLSLSLKIIFSVPLNSSLALTRAKVHLHWQGLYAKTPVISCQNCLPYLPWQLSYIYIGEGYAIMPATVTVTIYLPWPPWVMQHR
jgi:hypothetical protein